MYDPCIQEMMRVRHIREEHDIATTCAWIDDICATPHIVCGEVESCKLVVVDGVIFQEYEI
jgi:hypothetical protein